MNQRQWDTLEQAMGDFWTAMQVADLDAWDREKLFNYLLDEIHGGDPAQALKDFRKDVGVTMEDEK